MSLNAKSLCATAAALVFGLAACGDDDDDESAGTGTGTQAEQPAPSGPASQTVQITETEFKIDPARVVVDEPGMVEFQVENAGAATHALEVESESVDIEEETEDIAPGESATLTVDLTEGAYKLYCPIGDHEDRGMVGELTVGGGAASGGEGPGTDDSDGGGDDSGGATAPSDDDPGSDDDNSGGVAAPSDDGPGY